MTTPCLHPKCSIPAQVGHQHCILHRDSADKNPDEFRKAIASRQLTDDYSHMHFPAEYEFTGTLCSPDFYRTTFDEVHFVNLKVSGPASFNQTRFRRRSKFYSVRFQSKVTFDGAIFEQGLDCEIVCEDEVSFVGACFSESPAVGSSTNSSANFGRSRFLKTLRFDRARFRGAAHFQGAEINNGSFHGMIFEEPVHFIGSSFKGTTDFSRTQFHDRLTFQPATIEGTKVCFSGAYLNGRALVGREPSEQVSGSYLLSGIKAAFDNIWIGQSGSLRFHRVDFRCCRLIGTNARTCEFRDVQWPGAARRGIFGENRVRLYDEYYEHNKAKLSNMPWPALERLYRDLKINHEASGEYAKSSDWHYGEKEMQRRNRQSPLSLRIFLTLYWLVSGYGERYLRPLALALIVLLSSAFGYLYFGLEHGKDEDLRRLNVTELADWMHGLHFSLRTMALLGAEQFQPVGWAAFIQTAETLLGPVLLGFFALAVRQRLRR